MTASAASTATPDLLIALANKATHLRMDSVKATTEAGSGHPSSCCSAADIVAVLFFSVMRYDPKNPKLPNSDRFVLSKGHAAPLLYAAWAEAGLFPKSELLKLGLIEVANMCVHGGLQCKAPCTATSRQGGRGWGGGWRCDQTCRCTLPGK